MNRIASELKSLIFSFRECPGKKNKRDFAKLNWAQRMVKAAHSAKPCQPAVFNTNVTNSEKSREETLDTQRGTVDSYRVG